MTFNAEKPDITGKTPEAAIAALDTWAARLVDKLNYTLNHINQDNMDEKMVTEESVDKKIKESYEDLRGFVVQEVNNGEE